MQANSAVLGEAMILRNYGGAVKLHMIIPGLTAMSVAGQSQTLSPTDRCCMVVEVALFPPKHGLTEVSLGDLALRITGKDIATRPSLEHQVST
jgi:hypothetical protein